MIAKSITWGMQRGNSIPLFDSSWKLLPLPLLCNASLVGWCLLESQFVNFLQEPSHQAATTIHRYSWLCHSTNKYHTYMRSSPRASESDVNDDVYITGWWRTSSSHFGQFLVRTSKWPWDSQERDTAEIEISDRKSSD